MQFEPATFAEYASPVPPGGTTPASPYDMTDAVFAAARMLCANGAAGGADLVGALWDYNHSDAYVAAVLDLAGRLAKGSRPSGALGEVARFPRRGLAGRIPSAARDMRHLEHRASSAPSPDSGKSASRRSRNRQPVGALTAESTDKMHYVIAYERAGIDNGYDRRDPRMGPRAWICRRGTRPGA